MPQFGQSDRMAGKINKMTNGKLESSLHLFEVRASKVVKSKSIRLWVLSLLLTVSCMPLSSPSLTPTPATMNLSGVTPLVPSVKPGFTSLVWSPDSTRLAVTYMDLSSTDFDIPLEESRIQIQVLTIESQEITTLHVSNPGMRTVLAWLPDNQIAFYANHDLKEGTWTMPVNERERKRMNVEGVQAFFSPDGRRVAYLDTHLDTYPNRLSIWVQDLESGEQTEYFAYTERYLGEGELAWSPDGSQILFTFGTSKSFGDPPITYDQVIQNFDIWSVDVNSWHVEQLTDDGFHHSIAWSPDQKLIVYSHHENNNQFSEDALYLMQSDGTCPIQIIKPGSYDFESISWSPNGRWIAFIWGWRIYLLDTVEILGKDLAKYYSACP